MGSDIVDDDNDANGLRGQVALDLEKCRVEIQRAVTIKVDGGHDHQGADRQASCGPRASSVPLRARAAGLSKLSDSETFRRI